MPAWRRSRRRAPMPECHSGRTDPEARRKAVEELRRQRDLRHQDQALHVLAQRRRDGLEIDLGLARSRDPLEQDHRRLAGRAGEGAGGRAPGLRERGRRHRRGEHGRGPALVRRQRCAAMVRVRAERDRLRRQGDGLEDAVVDKAVDHPDADACRLRELALQVDEPALGGLHHPRPRRRQASRRLPGRTDPDPRRLGAPGFGQAQRQRQRRALRRERVPGDPIDQPPELRLEARGVDEAGDRLQVRAGALAQAPDDADRLPGPERHLHDVAVAQATGPAARRSCRPCPARAA